MARLIRRLKARLGEFSGKKTDATFNLGAPCQQEGDLKKAQEFSEEAHRGGNLDATAKFGMLYQLGDVKQAQELYAEAPNGEDLSTTFNRGAESGELRKQSAGLLCLATADQTSWS